MYYFLLMLLILDAILLMVIVLLQAGKGGGLAAMGGGGGGSDTLFGGRQAANLLTKSTWWTGGLFLALSLVLSIMTSRPAGTDSILRGEFPGRTAPAAGPIVPGMGESTQPTSDQLTPGAPGAQTAPTGDATATQASPLPENP
ncbi:hypothetical protein BH23GEM3_BH23GEM3_17840 [soil metagenome]|nr:preprotein translocase subunit SecG [Gemmatimonadota bacterium]